MHARIANKKPQAKPFDPLATELELELELLPGRHHDACIPSLHTDMPVAASAAVQPPVLPETGMRSCNRLLRKGFNLFLLRMG